MKKFAFRNDEENSARIRNREYEEALGHRLAAAGHTGAQVITMLGRGSERGHVMHGFHKYHENVQGGIEEGLSDQLGPYKR